MSGNQFVLVQEGHDGAPSYFKRMTAIGPMSTPKRSEAALFHDAQEAKQSPAYVHWGSFYEPKPLTPPTGGDSNG